MLLWCRPAATAPIRLLAWKPPYAAGAALEKTKKKKKKFKVDFSTLNFNIDVMFINKIKHNID